MQAELELTIEQKAAVVLLYQSFRQKFKHTQQELQDCYEALSQACCAVLCCAVLCCAVLYWAGLGCAVLC